MVDAVVTADADKEVIKNVEVSSDEHKAEFTSIEDALAEINKLRDINKDVIHSRDKAKTKLREFETAEETKMQSTLAEQGKYKELYDAEVEKSNKIVSKLKEKAVDSALEKALTNAGAEVKTALKLVDKVSIVIDDNYEVDMESVNAMVAKLQAEHEILFAQKDKVVIPNPKRPIEDPAKGGYDEELKALRTKASKGVTVKQSEFDALRSKYGRN